MINKLTPSSVLLVMDMLSFRTTQLVMLLLRLKWKVVGAILVTA